MGGGGKLHNDRCDAIFVRQYPFSGFLVVLDLEQSIKWMILVREGWGQKRRDDELDKSFLECFLTMQSF